MFLVGVPPRDVLEKLLQKETSGLNLIQRKKLDVQRILADPNRLNALMTERLESGEFDLKQIGDELRREANCCTSARQLIDDHADIEHAAKAYLRSKLQHFYEDWSQRLDTQMGLQTMCKVTAFGFSYKQQAISVWKITTGKISRRSSNKIWTQGRGYCSTTVSSTSGSSTLL